MGQDPELVGKIEAKKLHPAMAAFGLWKEPARPGSIGQKNPRRPRENLVTGGPRINKKIS
jgi:hypothetical protein